MKKYTFSLAISCLFAITIQSSGQITITQANMPVIGSKAVMAVDNSGSLAPQSGSSSAQTWNYSTLASTQTNSYKFVNPATTPYYAAFHNSNLADTLIYAPGYTYFSSTPTAYYETGFGEILYGYSIGIVAHPFYEQIAFPATYGAIDGGICRGDTESAFSYLLFDSARVTVTIIYSDTIDAFGLMTTPYGTDSVLRQKHYDKTTDSAFVHAIAGGWSLYRATTTTDYQYRWYAHGVPYYFALMQMNYTNTKDSTIEWFDGTDVGINEVSGESEKVNVYPNPATSEITFQFPSSDARYLTIFDVTGREISPQLTINNSQFTINTSAYSAGMYLYTISGINGNVLNRGKFVVQK